MSEYRAAETGVQPKYRLPIVFVGAMASGKTKIGKRLARLLDLPFIDTDRLIIDEHGSISEIFATHGESCFRRLERAKVQYALQQSAIVSLGGGAVLDRETRADLVSLTVVWLQISPEAVASRLGGETRPLLTVGKDSAERGSALSRWTKILAQRLPLYAEVATVSIDGSFKSNGTVLAEVRAALTAELLCHRKV